jgi:transcription elongation factor Elf1
MNNFNGLPSLDNFSGVPGQPVPLSASQQTQQFNQNSIPPVPPAPPLGQPFQQGSPQQNFQQPQAPQQPQMQAAPQQQTQERQRSTPKREDPETSAKKLRCPKCGSTEIEHNIESGAVFCSFCRTKIEQSTENTQHLTGSIDDIRSIEGEIFTPGMGELRQPDSDCLSFKCPSCKAEMSVDPNSNIAMIMCHWCRHHISAADKISNGVRPDGLIPFTISKEQAIANISAVMKKRKFFACPQFLKTFSPELVRPVFLPYSMVSTRAKSLHEGQAAVRKRQYTVSSGKNNRKTVYDFDVYEFGRQFDLFVNNLLIEANTAYFLKAGECITENSKNIINSIQPFDTSKIIDYDPRFLSGDFRAEFRDVPVDAIREKSMRLLEDVSIHQVVTRMPQYNHGQIFQKNGVNRLGTKYSSILAPVWLYSYYDPEKHKLSYICCNGQTGETAVSVPVYKTKLLITAAIIQLIATPIALVSCVFGG